MLCFSSSETTLSKRNFLGRDYVITFFPRKLSCRVEMWNCIKGVYKRFVENMPQLFLCIGVNFGIMLKFTRYVFNYNEIFIIKKEIKFLIFNLFL